MGVVCSALVLAQNKHSRGHSRRERLSACRRHLPILISANPDHWLGRLAPVFNARKRNIFIILAHWALQSEPDMSGLDHTASAYQMLGLVLRSVRRYYENVLFPSMHSKIDVKRMSNLISIQGETV
jgi:hypothetical protein